MNGDRDRDAVAMWFEELFGFRESSYEETKRRFAVEGQRLLSLANGDPSRSASGHTAVETWPSSLNAVTAKPEK